MTIKRGHLMAKGQSRYTDLTGKTFGRLVPFRHEIVGGKQVYWFCKCSCGKEKRVMAQPLVLGSTRSCGCLNDEVRRANATHGATRNAKHSPEYTCWHSMKQRCSNPNNLRYARYGGRGITVCESWLEFAPFLQHMGPRPSLKHTIERIDNNLGYSPINCIWATKAEQNRNNSRNRFFTFRGEKLCVADWMIRTGLKHATIHNRLKYWSVERALTQRPSLLT